MAVRSHKYSYRIRICRQVSIEREWVLLVIGADEPVSVGILTNATPTSRTQHSYQPHTTTLRDILDLRNCVGTFVVMEKLDVFRLLKFTELTAQAQAIYLGRRVARLALRQPNIPANTHWAIFGSTNPFIFNTTKMIPTRILLTRSVWKGMWKSGLLSNTVTNTI